MPPPEPKSSTVSPAFNFANAVGLPQPRDARTASSGIALVWLASYRFDVIGSTHPLELGAAPQQELPRVLTRSAASPYFSRTFSFTSMSDFSYLHICVIFPGLMALLRVQHSAYRNPSSSSRAAVLAVYRRNVLSRRTVTRSSFLSFSR